MIGGTKRMCEEFVLSNGLRVVAEPIENFPSVSVGLWIGAGSMYESAEENGLSHFVEHILFKSTERRTTKDIAVEMDALGGQVNAFTAKECTCYYAKVIAEHLPRAMDLLCDMLLNARVDEAEFEKERGVVPISTFFGRVSVMADCSAMSSDALTSCAGASGQCCMSLAAPRFWRSIWPTARRWL